MKTEKIFEKLQKYILLELQDLHGLSTNGFGN